MKAKKTARKSDAENPWNFTKHLYKNMGGKIGKKKEDELGITVEWPKMFASLAQSLGKVPPSKTEKPAQGVATPTPVDGDEEARKLIIENPSMTAAVFYNTLKSKGLTIVDTKPDTIKKAAKIAPTEAEGGSSNAAVLRVGAKESDRIHLRFKFLESSSRDNGVGATRFKVALIREGLGNLSDTFYYTRQSLESLVPLMEGAKIFANHPRKSEEEDIPERDVRDIIGHYESVHIEEDDDGAAQLVADLCIMPDEPYRWARALLTHAIEFAEKFPDKDFVGLSINAGGYGQPVLLSDFIKESNLPKSAIPKIQKAMDEGIESIKVVREFSEAISTDLVTRAGAGGKVLQMIEQEKK